jgi:hypothetical protein
VYTDGFAQWKKIADFGELITTIYFQEFDDTPTIGFVGLEAPRLATKLWRTTDGGKTFTAITYPLDVSGRYTIPHHFTFKDNLRGWFSGVDGNSIFETDDGGLTWKIVFTGSISGIAYVPTTNLLLCSNVGASYSSSIDGINFNSITRTDLPSTRSITFSDDLHGIITAIDTYNGMLVTSDGGNNWVFSDLHSEFYQPLGIRGTQRFYLMSEASRSFKNNILFRSNDGGMSWTQLFAYKQPDLYLTTGTVQYGIDESIFFQTTELGNDGIMMSVDSGLSFFSICGPSTRGDTKFFVRDSFIYAGDKLGGLWLNTTGIGSNSRPILSDTTVLMSTNSCNVTDTLILFTMFDSCNGRQAQLVSASVSGSPRFSIISGDDPRTIVIGDSLRVKFDPQIANASNDSARLHLRFKLGWKEFDTVVTFIGNVNQKDSLSFLAMLTKPSVISGDTTELRILPDKATANKNLSEIHFDVTLDVDVLEPLTNFTSEIPEVTSVIMLPPVAVGKLSRYSFIIRGSNMSLSPTQAIVNLPMRSYLSDTTMTTIEVSTINLNPQDPDYEQCTLSAMGSDVPFALQLMCGDSLLSRYLGSKPILSIISLKPNPTKSDVTVTFDLARGGTVKTEVLDVLGNVVKEETLEARQGETRYHISLPDAPEGVYYVRLRYASQTRTGKLIVE